MAGRATTCALTAVMLTACGGGGGGGGGSSGSGGTTPPPASTFTIGGTISGLTETGLTLNDNGGDTLTVAPGATAFTFATALASGASYDVAVATQPLGENCTATANTGTASANVTSVAIACADSGVAVATLAGSPPGAGGTAGTAGNANGTGSAATFSAPAGVAVDSSGNVYVAEYGNNDIRKITPEGVVTLFAGSSSATQGDANGTGDAASFWNPTGVAVDSAGNVYVADESNNQIRMITPGGAVTVFAGSPTGAIGDSNGTGSTASFSAPNGIAIDSSGNLWVTDSGNNEIREITTPGAVVTTPYGNPTAGKTNANGNTAQFHTPTAIAVDPTSGNLFVADAGNNEIREINVTTTAVTLFAGSAGGTAGSGNGTGSGASFSAPSGIAIDATGNLYIADTKNSEIRMATPAGVVSTYAGSTSGGYVNGTSSAAEFNYPFGIVNYSGTLYVGDDVNNAIRVIAP
jgi:DNA-binding beta-propeller fold protein YncE